MAFPVVKGPGGKRYELLEGMKQHFLSLYGEWENGTIMCPPLFPRDFISPVGDLPGVPPLKPHVLDTIRGDDAEEKIFEILKQFGEKEMQPMFVLTKLKITELFMKYCMPDQTFQDLKKLSEKTKKKKLDVEIDFAIVHLNIGVILVEVKATDKWPKRNAFTQVSEREKIIKGLLHEDSHVPIYTVVALPNMDGSGNCKDDFFILKKSDVGSCEEFSHWMHSHFNAEKCGSQEKQELRNLLYKLVGERTRVGSLLETVEFSDDVHPEKVLSEHYKNICSQACLRKRYECSIAKENGKKPIGLVKTSDKPGLAELAEEIVFLNSEQLCIWEGSNKQLISGASGSGKTILLQYKALECARKGEKVMICVPSPLNKKYKAFFEGKNVSSGVSIYTFKSFVNFFPESEEKFHLFVDELQILFAHNKTKMSYLMLLLEKQSSDNYCYCWFASDDTQFMTSRTSFQRSDQVHVVNTFCFAKAYINTEHLLTQDHRFITSCLKTVMRSTEQVFEFVQEFAHKTGIYSQIVDSKHCYMKGNVPDPSWKDDWQVIIGHRIGGLPVEEIETYSLETLATNIFSEVRKWRLKEVVVLVTDYRILKYLAFSCILRGIPWCAIGEDKDALVLDHGGKSHSFEWPVVIAVCGSESQPYLRYLTFSRAVVKLVVYYH